MNPRLWLDGISKTFPAPDGSGDFSVLENIHLEIAEGESVAIQGRSGSGKSTLLSIMGGMEFPTHGEVRWNGAALKSAEDFRKLRRTEIGIVFQTFQLLPHFPALENVAFMMELNGEAQAEKRAHEWLERVELSHRKDALPGLLSGGEKQRVAIARALSIQPKLVLADEPTGSLDEKTGDHVMRLFLDLVKESKASLILVTHNPSFSKLCDRRFELNQGRLA
jgi:putative ABC transport system ATP-binding protein